MTIDRVVGAAKRASCHHPGPMVIDVQSRRTSQVQVMNQSSTLIRGGNVIATLLAASALTFCTAYTGEELAKDANIDIQAVRDTALEARLGKITGEELEKEKGGIALFL